MTLVRRNNSLLPGFDGLFNDFFNDDFFNASRQRGFTSTPAVNVQEKDGDYQIELAAPGLNRDDFNVEVDGDRLTISSKMEDRKEEADDKGNYTRREFHYSSFSRSFMLPETVDGENISAKYDNGVLYVLLPKKAELAKPDARTIEIG